MRQTDETLAEAVKILELGFSPRSIVNGNRIELLPSRDIREMRGFLKGIDTTVIREADRL